MNKTFSKFLFLLTSIMLLAISCTNASQISFKDSSKNKFSKPGISTVSIILGDMPSYRTIFPDEWDADSKQSLFYKLTGTKAAAQDFNSEAEPTQTDFISNGKVFTYNELITGKAVIELDPIHWDLTLTAYQGNGAETPALDPKKPVLEAKLTSVDLTTGDSDLIFDLKTTTGESTTGNIDITVKFYDDATIPVAKTTLDLLAGNKNPLIATDNAPIQTVTVESTEFTGIANKLKSVFLSLGADKNVAPGTYYFKITFYDENSKIMLQHIESVKVDGGNTSSGVIKIPEHSLNGIPTKPEELKVLTYFAPDSNSLTIDKAKKIYAQQSTTETNANNKYNATFTWKDTSYNETGFALSLLKRGDTADKTIVITDDPTGNITITPVCSDITYVEGGLGPSYESLTLAVTPGVFFDDMTIAAVNELVDLKNDTIKQKVTAKQTVVTTDNPMGMFTVTYKLSNKANIGGGQVEYDFGTENTTTMDYYIQAYNFIKDKTSALPLSDKNINFPFVKSSSAFNFGGWYQDNTTAKEITKWEDLNEGLNTNASVYSAWLNKRTVKVTYPNYNDFRDLQTVEDHNKAILAVPDGNFVVTIPNNTEKTVPIFKVYKGVGTDIKVYYDTEETQTKKNDASITVNNNVLTWNTSEFSPKNAGGTYTVYTKYTYKGNPVDGCLYVELSN